MQSYTHRNGWVDIMRTPILAATTHYEYYPMYVLTEESYQETIDLLVTHPDNIPPNTTKHNVSNTNELQRPMDPCHLADEVCA